MPTTIPGPGMLNIQKMTVNPLVSKNQTDLHSAAVDALLYKCPYMQQGHLLWEWGGDGAAAATSNLRASCNAG